MTGLHSGGDGKFLGETQAPISIGGPRRDAHLPIALTLPAFTTNVGPSILGLSRTKGGLGPCRLLLHK